MADALPGCLSFVQQKQAETQCSSLVARGAGPRSLSVFMMAMCLLLFHKLDMEQVVAVVADGSQPMFAYKRPKVDSTVPTLKLNNTG